MHRFFDQYAEESRLAMKQWLRFRDQEAEFHQNAECWSYQIDSKLFWNFFKSFALELSHLARRVMMLSVNSVLAERNWSVMNLIMSKIRNSLHSINVNKLMFIYMNERALNRFTNMKSRLQLSDINIDETEFCEMKDKLLQKEVSLTTMTSFKRSTSQTIMSDASRSWINT
jgi:hypothetical protein